jgi:hypothetical protein
LLETNAISESGAKALALANGLRKRTIAVGRRWSARPGGSKDVAKIVACIDGIERRLQTVPDTEDGDADVAALSGDLRVILEWTAYQSASVATAQALTIARKTRAFAERFGLFDDPASRLSVLLDSEQSLIENVRTKNDYMRTLALQNPHLGLPQPLVNEASLAPRVARKPGRLDLIQLLMKSTKP